MCQGVVTTNFKVGFYVLDHVLVRMLPSPPMWYIYLTFGLRKQMFSRKSQIVKKSVILTFVPIVVFILSELFVFYKISEDIIMNINLCFEEPIFSRKVNDLIQFRVFERKKIKLYL